MLPVESVRPNKWNVNMMPKEEYKRLKAEMAKTGPEKTEAITVRKAEDGAWEIVNGEQRWQTAKELGWKAIPAQEVEADRREAKYLSLSYNALRGTVDYVKLSRLLPLDPEMVEATIRVFGKELTDSLLESGRLLTKEAEQMLKKAIEEGAHVTPTKVEAVAKVPPLHQPYVAYAAMDRTDEDFVKAAAQEYINPEKGAEEAKGEAEKEAEEEEEEAEGVSETIEELFGKYPEVGRTEKKKEPVTIAGKTYEVADYVSINGKQYVIYYDGRGVGIRQIKMGEVEGKPFQAYEDMFKLPKIYTVELKCKCGRLWRGQFDASSGTCMFNLAEE